MTFRPRRFIGCLVTGALIISPARAQTESGLQSARLAYVERLGEHLPAELTLRAFDGRNVRLAELSSGRPLILVLGYFKCPNLCGVVRASLYKALDRSGLAAGLDYSLAAMSVDPQENSLDAQTAREEDLKAFGVIGDPRSVVYLTASAKTIRAMTAAAGFHDELVQGSVREWQHPVGVVFATSDGLISSYLLGVGYRPSQVRLALERARVHDVATEVAAPLLLLCFHFDPATGRYSLEVLKLLRLGAVLTMVVVAGLLFLSFRRERIRA